MTTCKILADSVNPAGVRLTSVVATYPRFIHSELLTHRAMSRNAASSRDYSYSNFDNPRVIYGQRGYSTSGLSHWQQYRKQFTGENVVRVNPEAIMANKPDWITL